MNGNLYHPIVPVGAMRITRPTRWSNPYPLDRYSRFEALTLYRGWLLGDPDAIVKARTAGCRLRLNGSDLVDAARRELAGHDLACWCALELPCHGDLLLSVVETLPGSPIPLLLWTDRDQPPPEAR